MTIAVINLGGLVNFGQCICDETGKVIEQNIFVEKICGNQKGKICSKGCRKFLEVGSDYDVSVLKNRYINDQYFHITGHKIDNQELIILHPAPSCSKTFNFEILSPREKEIAEMMLGGLLNSEIVRRLQITKATLKTHINRIYQKIGDEFKMQRFELLS